MESIAGTIAIFKNGIQFTEDNECIWKLSVSGEYSVKSRYELARKCILSYRPNIGEVSDPTSLNLKWRLFQILVVEVIK